MPSSQPSTVADQRFMKLALRLARKGVGRTSPNPAVGAVLVRDNRIIGRGWHRAAGLPHAEIEALADAGRLGNSVRGATLYVTLEPCSTYGRTPPCTGAIVAVGIRRVVVATADPNPAHSGRGLRKLRREGIRVDSGLCSEEATRLNEVFNHWIVHQTPFVVVKSAMTLDGKIATPSGESRWITGSEARREAMRLRASMDAVLVGIGTVLADNPSLTVRSGRVGENILAIRRIVLDGAARTPLTSRVVTDAWRSRTIVVVGPRAPRARKQALGKRVTIWTAPERRGGIDLRWLIRRLGKTGVTSLLVEGGGEIIASFLSAGLVHRANFFIAPKILGGRGSRKAVAGNGAGRRADITRFSDVRWRRCGEDLLLSGGIGNSAS